MDSLSSHQTRHKCYETLAMRKAALGVSLVLGTVLTTGIALFILKAMAIQPIAGAFSYYTLGGWAAGSGLGCILFAYFSCASSKKIPDPNPPKQQPVSGAALLTSDPSQPLVTAKPPQQPPLQMNSNPIVIPAFIPMSIPQHPFQGSASRQQMVTQWPAVKNTSGTWTLHTLSQALHVSTDDISALFKEMEMKPVTSYPTEAVNLIIRALERSADPTIPPPAPVSVLWNGGSPPLLQVSGKGTDRAVWRLETLAHFLAVDRDDLKGILETNQVPDQGHDDYFSYSREDLDVFFKKMNHRLLSIFPPTRRTQKDSIRWFLTKL